MTRKVVTIDMKDPVELLIRKFKTYDFHSFPVLDEDRLIGICTKTDLLKIIDKKLTNIAVKNVKDVMTPHPTTVDPDTLLSDAASLMKKNHIRILPVVTDGKLVGLLSYSDLVRTIYSQVEDEF